MFENLSNYRHADPLLWQGRKDTPNAERFFQKVTFPTQQTDLISKEKKPFLLALLAMPECDATRVELGQNWGLTK